MNIRSPVTGADGAIPELVGRAQQLRSIGSQGTRICNGWIEKEHVVVVFQEWAKNIPAKAGVNGQTRRDFDVILEIRSIVDISEPAFDRKLALARICIAQEIAGERAPRVLQISGVGRGQAAEGETSTALLAFLVVLIRTADFESDVHGVAAMSPEPVVIEAYAQFAVDGERFPIRVHTPRCWHERISRK